MIKKSKGINIRLDEPKESSTPKRVREEKKGFVSKINLSKISPSKLKLGKVNVDNFKHPLPYIMLGGGLVAGLAIGICFSLGNGDTKTLDTSFSESIELAKGGIEFAAIEYPEGWKVTKPESDVSKASNQNPFPGLSKSCSFTPSTVYLAKGSLGFGSDYLSKELLLNATKESPKAGLPVESKISFNNASISAWERQSEKSLTVVRAFDGKVIDTPKDFKKTPPRGLETMTDSGIPAVVMTYSCQNTKDVDFDVAHSLVSAANVTLASADN